MTKAEAFLIAVLLHKDPKLLFKADKSWFDAPETAKFRYITDYYREHGELMGPRAFCSKFRLDSTGVDSRPGLYYRELRDRFVFSEISEHVPGLLKKVKDDPRKVLKEMSALVSKLNTDEGHSRDSYYTDDAKERVDAYLERVKTKGVSYMSTGSDVLDELFYGYRKSDLITIGGRAGSRKTWLLCYLALKAELVLKPEMNDIMIVTNEVPTDELKERMDAILFQLPYERFLSGKLTRAEFARYKEGIGELKKKRLLFIENINTIDELNNKVEIYKPCSVFLDGSYLMENGFKGQEWEKITYVTRNLKQIAKNTEIPVINTTQLGRRGGKTEKSTSFDAQEEFAYSNSYVQDSDLAFRNYTTKEMLLRQEVGMTIAKGRRVNSEKVPIFLSNMNTMEFDFYLAEEEELESAEESLLL